MKCLILAAGYATRLYPLTENFPKPLLKVGEKTILDWLVDDIAATGRVDGFVVISNQKFAEQFEVWAQSKPLAIEVVDDGTSTNETRLGAVRDIQFALDKLSIADDVLVIAGDNVLDFSFSKFITFAEEKQTSCVMCHEENELAKQQRTAIITFDENNLITSYEEKPKEPKGNHAVPPFYFYQKKDIARIGEALADGCNADAPGSFAAWLSHQTPVHAYPMPGKRYDIGNLESYRHVQEAYHGIVVHLTGLPIESEKENNMREYNVPLNGKTVFLTGVAGFICSNLAVRLLKDYPDIKVVGIDLMTDYNSIALKKWRLAQIEKAANGRFEFIEGDISDKALIDSLFEKHGFAVVVNLAAQAGVRYSIDHPDVYIQSNIIGFYNLLEACRHYPVEHLVYASSSSVYGGNKKVPFSTEDKVDNPVSLYAATKKSNELMAHAYSKLYNIPSTGLRFFTVYGPAGREDMYYFSATNALRRGETIRIFNYGNCKRDFTYIDDIVEGVVRVMQGAPEKKNGEDGLPIPPYAVYNIGGGTPENLLDYINTLQEELVLAGVLPADFDFDAHKELVGMQPGDVPVTYADSSALERDFGFTPKIGIRDGLRAFAEWYKAFYMSK